MTNDQFAQLLTILEKIVSKQYTITGAADWPILYVVGGILGGILVAVIGAMWVDLRSTIKENKVEWRGELRELEEKTVKGEDLIWSALRECQNECCPRGKR